MYIVNDVCAVFNNVFQYVFCYKKKKLVLLYKLYIGLILFFEIFRYALVQLHSYFRVHKFKVYDISLFAIHIFCCCIELLKIIFIFIITSYLTKVIYMWHMYVILYSMQLVSVHMQKGTLSFYKQRYLCEMRQYLPLTLSLEHARHTSSAVNYWKWIIQIRDWRLTSRKSCRGSEVGWARVVVAQNQCEFVSWC